MPYSTLIRRAALPAACALLLIPAGTGTARAGTETAGPAGPATHGRAGHVHPRLAVGTWETEIDFGGGDMVRIRQAYTRAGELCHTGGVHGYGKGTWWPTGANTFSYEVVEIFRNDEGQYAGRAEMTGTAVQTGRTFTTDHVSHVYDAEGNSLGADAGEIVFERVSKRNPPCPELP